MLPEEKAYGNCLKQITIAMYNSCSITIKLIVV